MYYRIIIIVHLWYCITPYVIYHITVSTLSCENLGPKCVSNVGLNYGPNVAPILAKCGLNMAPMCMGPDVLLLDKFSVHSDAMCS